MALENSKACIKAGPAYMVIKGQARFNRGYFSLFTGMKPGSEGDRSRLAKVTPSGRSGGRL